MRSVWLICDPLLDASPYQYIIDYVFGGFLLAATLPVPDLGLDNRKLPDLSDAETRQRLSPAAIEAFFAIADRWHLKNDAAMALLGGVSHGRYYELKKNPKRGVLAQDEITRISLLVGIFKALNILFTETLANDWVSRPNSNPMFGNTPPLVSMIQIGMPRMSDVRRLLDGRRGGR